jgi:hypothetical protein
MKALEGRGTFALPFGSVCTGAELNGMVKAEGETESDAEFAMLGDMVEDVMLANSMERMMRGDGTGTTETRSLMISALQRCAMVETIRALGGGWLAKQAAGCRVAN